MIDNKLGLFFINQARKAYCGKIASASSQQSLLLQKIDGPKTFDLKGVEAEAYVKQLLLKNEPCMIARFGSTEMETILTHLNMQSDEKLVSKLLGYIKGDKGCFLSYHARLGMPMSGIFPTSKEMVSKFATQMLQDIKNIDVLGSWLADDYWLQQRYFPNSMRVPLRNLEPFRSKDPWSSALEGQTVLVIHPFEESIRKQYFEKRDRLFENKQMLPAFELKTLKAVQSSVGTHVGFADWFEAFDYMCKQISNIEFDVAIIGAGGYGLPLASFIKTKMQKKAVHLGGATQIMFGVKGKKWVEDPVFSGLFNKHWIGPSQSETPENFKRLEGGSYW